MMTRRKPRTTRMAPVPARCGRWTFIALLLLGVAPALADVTGLTITHEETLTIGGKPVRHLAGVISGTATRNEPGVPTLDKVVGLKYESNFELWIPVDGGNGRFWFGVLNRGGESGGLRSSVLARGGSCGWCAWQAVNVKEPKPQLKLSGFDGPMPQAYGMVVKVRDFVAFLRYSHGTEALPNPAAGKVRFAFAFGVSQSGRFMRTFLLHGLNTAPQGKVFDGLLPNGARAGYLDLFRPNSDPGSGGTFSAETVYAPYSWSDLMARSGTDAKVFALNAESEFYQMMAYMSHHGSVPENVRVYEFPLGGHGGGGAVPWNVCSGPLSIALEEWACNGTKPPDSRMFTLAKSDNPRVKHLPSEPAESPVVDNLGIALGGVRLPPVEVPTARYTLLDNGSYKAEPLDKAELTRRYGTPENYRKIVAEAIDQLSRDGFLPETARAKYIADAEKVSW